MPGAGKAAEQPQPSPRAVLAEIKDDTAAAENNRASGHTRSHDPGAPRPGTDQDRRRHTPTHTRTLVHVSQQLCPWRTEPEAIQASVRQQVNEYAKCGEPNNEDHPQH